MTSLPKESGSLLTWNADEPTVLWTKRLPVAPHIARTAQSGGKGLTAQTWKSYLLASDFPEFCYSANDKVFCSPANIIRCFREERMLEGLALTIGWGRMWRKPRTIYQQDKATIERALTECFVSLQETRSAETAWLYLFRELRWTNTMASKCLHFLCRSAGFEQNPCVPLDGRVILNTFAVQYDAKMREQGGNPAELGTWRDKQTAPKSWAAYNRSMTAVCCWAEMQNWTTTEVENALFDYPKTFLR